GRLFFFSSRRRHTRFSRDWSSDVCSSDLQELRRLIDDSGAIGVVCADADVPAVTETLAGSSVRWTVSTSPLAFQTRNDPRVFGRSEERRVGKECRSRWPPDN